MNVDSNPIRIEIWIDVLSEPAKSQPSNHHGLARVFVDVQTNPSPWISPVAVRLVQRDDDQGSVQIETSHGQKWTAPQRP